MRTGPSRLVLAALVVGATGAASASGAAGAAVEVAGTAGVVGLIRAGSCTGALPLSPFSRGACIQLRASSCCDVDQDSCSAPLIAYCAATPASIARAHAVIEVSSAARPAPRAIAVLPFAPKTSPPALI